MAKHKGNKLFFKHDMLLDILISVIKVQQIWESKLAVGVLENFVCLVFFYFYLRVCNILDYVNVWDNVVFLQRELNKQWQLLRNSAFYIILKR